MGYPVPCIVFMTDIKFYVVVRSEGMVLILDGNSVVGIGTFGVISSHLICLRYFERSKAVKNLSSFSENTYFPSCVRNMFRVSSDHLI